MLHNGKVKVYGSFGYFYDIMKFQLPRGSFGGDYWHDCVYALDSPDFTQIIPQRDSQGHYCPLGGGSTAANGSFPAMRFIENVDYRAPSNDPNQAGSLGATGLVDPNLKPMKQHVITIGASWELKHDLVFEPVYTRTRLDRTIEDAGTITQDGEVYYITNPGFGINATVPNCNGCPPNIKAIRNYDGLELRLTKRFSHDWFGAFSYTYSRLYGNYDGLTSTDVSDGIGRNGANSDRAFDEPFMSYNAHGQDVSGPLGNRPPAHLQGEHLLQPQVVEVQYGGGSVRADLLGHPAEQLHQRVGRSGVRRRPRQVRQRDSRSGDGQLGRGFRQQRAHTAVHPVGPQRLPGLPRQQNQ